MPGDVSISEKSAGTYPWQSIPFYQPSQSLRRNRLRRVVGGILIGVVILTIYGPHRYINFSGSLECRHLPGARDTVVIMKTGVTELTDRLPIHLETTMKCYPNSIIYSDHDELFQEKYEIRDVLANIDPVIQQENDDFKLWRQVKEVGRGGLQPVDITGKRLTSKTSKEEKVEIAGWVLDKWKFLPMLNETFHLYPHHKWYVFHETDTYLFWSTTLKYLSSLDHKKPILLGHRSTVRSPHPFAHGGSGYIVSNPALRMLVAYIEANRADLDKFVASEWAGDIALGLVLREIGVPITPAWPIYQPHHFGTIDFGLTYENKRFWCYPAGSFHHMTPDSVEDLWNFEQDWIKEEYQPKDDYSFIRHGDVFGNVILPRMWFPRSDWDNQSSNLMEGVDNIDDCKQTCLDDEDCVQYMFDTNSQECKTLHLPRYGEASQGSGIFSEWIYDRVEQWRNDQPGCEDEWFLPPEDDEENEETWT